MIKLINNMFLHLSMASEMLIYFLKQKQWAMLPGLLVWSLLPLFITISVLGLLVITVWVSTAFFGSDLINQYLHLGILKH